MEKLSKETVSIVNRPVRVIQFGEGNFLRGFVDYMLDIANESGNFDGSIVLVKPIPFGSLDKFRQQDNLYTVSLRGIVDGKICEQNRIVTSIADTVDAYDEYDKYASYAKLDTLRFLVSNTTEAGIVYDATDDYNAKPPKTYPGKLTKFLHERYTYFQGDITKGLVILPVELIDDNGRNLKECVMKFVTQWNLGTDFAEWITKSCEFCSTLVDRIVTGYPKGEEEQFYKKLGYRDELIVTGEPFALWVIESERDISEELPLVKAGLPVIYTNDAKPYKQRKVRILNGAHTSFVPASYLAGNDYVRESMDDELINGYMYHTIFHEVIPTLDLPVDELTSFAKSVITRFCNPYVKHSLLAISLNSISKWRARCMPSLLEYVNRRGELPSHLTFSLAALIAFYKGSKIEDGALIGHRDKDTYRICDDAYVLEFFSKNAEQNAIAMTHLVLSNADFWGRDLSTVPKLQESVAGYLEDIHSMGMRGALRANFKNQEN